MAPPRPVSVPAGRTDRPPGPIGGSVRARSARWLLLGGVALLVASCGGGSSERADDARADGGPGLGVAEEVVERAVDLQGTLDRLVRGQTEMMLSTSPTAESIVPPATPALGAAMAQNYAERAGRSWRIGGGPVWSLQSTHEHDEVLVAVLCIEFEQVVVERPGLDDLRIPHHGLQQVYQLRRDRSDAWEAIDTTWTWEGPTESTCPPPPDEAETCDCLEEDGSTRQAAFAHASAPTGSGVGRGGLPTVTYAGSALGRDLGLLA